MSDRMRSRYAGLLAFILLLAAAGPFGFRPFPVYGAEVPQLSSIRVALFIDGRGTVPLVTLSSQAALAIGERRPDGVSEWFRVESGQPVRFTLDGYRLQVAETADVNAALDVYAKIAPAGQPYLYIYSVKGTTMYRVGLEGYRSAESASAAAASVGIPGNRGQFVVRGPFYASAGTYGSEAEAAEQQARLAQRGIVSELVVLPGKGGGAAWAVWFGEAADAGQLEKAKAQAAEALPGLIPAPADTASAYLVKRKEMAAGQEMMRYAFPAAGQKIWVSAGSSPIRVEERYGRSYRGAMELTAFNGSLAVINELPFEEYLVSVVGTELDPSWPLETLKAQAVASRTFALALGMKYRIAHISDTSADQAYRGIEAEFPAAAEAVEATRGEVLVHEEGLITPFYHSNGGGRTAGADEVWTAPLAYIKSVSSPDQIAQQGKLKWYRIMLPDGSAGYIRSDFASLSAERNAAGLPYVEVKGTDVNIRRAPHVDNANNPPVAQANTGDRFVWIGEDLESNAFNWIRGPYTAAELAASLRQRGAAPALNSIEELEIASRGPSGRVAEIKANGQRIALEHADALRSALGGLPSTRFEIEPTGKYTILASGGKTRDFPAARGPLYAAGSRGGGELKLRQFYVMNGAGEVRAATLEPAFRFIGLGNGHGIGMSQHGARALAEQGYDYQQILKYYYNGVRIVKE